MELPTVKLVNQMPVITALPSAQSQDNFEYGENGTVVVLDQEKKIRREIANSNERRRMQSINSGFQSLRTLLPHHEGEKLSKAAILQQTAEYIYSLEQEKTRLLAQNCHLKRLLSLSQQQHHDQDTTAPTEAKRRKGKAETKVPEVAETRVEGYTDLGLSQIELIKEPEPIKIATSTPAVTIVPPQSVITASVAEQQKQPPVKVEQPKNETPQSTKTTKTPTTTFMASAAATLKTGEPCRIILAAANNSSNSSTTSVAPIRPTQKTVTAPVKVVPDAKVEKKEEGSSARSFVVGGSSKQNLDSIVEAIKHLEGDHLFSSGVNVPNEVAKEEVVEYSMSEVVLPTVPVPMVQQQQQPQTSATKDTFIIFKN